MVKIGIGRMILKQEMGFSLNDNKDLHCTHNKDDMTNIKLQWHIHSWQYLHHTLLFKVSSTNRGGHGSYLLPENFAFLGKHRSI